MDWRTPERVFGSGLEPVVLRVLWTAGRPMTGEQVARVARDGSPRGIRYALGRLVGQGIVTTQDVGASVLYDLNTEHLLYGAVDAAFNAMHPWEHLKHRIEVLVERPYPQGDVTVALFGSVARGTATIDSDVDVLVVAPVIDERAGKLRTQLVDGIRAWTGQAVGVYLTTPALLAEADAASDLIIESFRREAKTLVGPPVANHLPPADTHLKESR